ncbi:hypothetical protein BVRB_1g010820 [Beta vulgaris subsp. vulgaris]|nr:hypothetical protein BVRB_1g010820 [Beta vulgaris subsp. vulgaris]
MTMEVYNVVLFETSSYLIAISPSSMSIYPWISNSKKITAEGPILLSTQQSSSTNYPSTIFTKS